MTAALESIDYDGGTQLGAIAPIEGASPIWPCSSATASPRSAVTSRKPLGAPLYAFSCDAGATSLRLQHLTHANGGRYFNLPCWSDAEVVAAVGRPACMLLSAAVKGGRADDLLPARPQPVAGHFMLVGRLDDPQALVTLRYGLAGKGERERTFAVDRAEAVYGQLLQRFWARRNWKNC